MNTASHFGVRRYGLAGLAVLACIAPLSAQAPPTTTPSAAELLTPEVVEAQRQQAEQLAEVDAEVENSALEQYRIALENLQRAANLEKARAELERNTASAADRARQAAQKLENLRQQLAGVKDGPSDQLAGQSLSQLEQELVVREQNLRELRDELKALDQQIADRPGRRKAIRAKLASADPELAEINSQLEAVPPTGEAAVLTQAKKTNLLTQRQLATVEQPSLQAELALLDAEDAVELLRLNRELTATELELAEALSEARSGGCTKGTGAGGAGRGCGGPIGGRAGRSRFAVSGRSESAIGGDGRCCGQESPPGGSIQERLLDGAGATEKRLNDARRRVDKFVDGARLPASVGAALRVKRSHLPDVRDHASRLQRRQRFIDEAQILLWDLEDERTNLPTVEQAIERAVEVRRWRSAERQPIQ